MSHHVAIINFKTKTGFCWDTRPIISSSIAFTSCILVLNYIVHLTTMYFRPNFRYEIFIFFYHRVLFNLHTSKNHSWFRRSCSSKKRFTVSIFAWIFFCSASVSGLLSDNKLVTSSSLFLYFCYLRNFQMFQKLTVLRCFFHYFFPLDSSLYK